MPRTMLLALLLLALPLAGCEREEPRTPTACLEGSEVFLAAAQEAAAGEAAPRLDDGTAVSDCLVRGQQAGPLAEVGGSMLTAIQRLNREARADPGGAANRSLGLLLGAAEAGASNTSGIHTDLIRRLDAAARLSPGGRPLPASFERSLDQGIAAGRGE